MQGSLSENDTLPFYPNNSLQSKNRKIWISQSNHSIGRMGKEGFRSYAFSESTSAQELQIAEDPEGGIWVLSPLDGLFQYNQSSDSFVKRLNVSGGRSLLIHDDHLLLGNDALYVYLLTEDGLRLERTIPMEEDLVTALHVDQNNEFFAGTQKGKLYHLKDLETEPRTIYGANEAHRVEELDFKQINEIYVTYDAEGRNDKLWVSSASGLWLLQQQFFKTVEDLPMNNPIGIAIGAQERAWVPMNYLYQISREEDDFRAKPIFDNMQV
ncbi:MAG: hypothetical protein HKP08_04675, partial [Flavobacteriaceae bacterium]|nr:hypothetical protein [Flavobacteriaceae bacterium]